MADEKQMKRWLTDAVSYCDGILLNRMMDKKIKEKYKELKYRALGYETDLDDGVLPSWKRVEILNFLSYYFYFVLFLR